MHWKDLIVQETRGWLAVEDSLEAWSVYLDFLWQENRKINLTSLDDPLEIALKHFLDSLMVLRWLAPPLKAHVVDIGTGGGFPGLPLKLVRPDLRLTLVESRQKKARFLEKLTQKLDFQDVKVLAVRAEEAARDRLWREQYHWAVSRGVAELKILAEYCLPFVRPGGFLVAWKGRQVEKEIKEAENSLAVLGGSIKGLYWWRVPYFGEQRSLLAIEKTRPLSSAYPRRPGVIRKRPL